MNMKEVKSLISETDYQHKFLGIAHTSI